MLINVKWRGMAGKNSDDEKRRGKRPVQPESDSNSNIENVTNAYILARQQGITLDAARAQLLRQAGTSRRHAALARDTLESPDVMLEMSKRLGVRDMTALAGTSRGVRRATLSTGHLGWKNMVQGVHGNTASRRAPTAAERVRYGIPAEVKRVLSKVPRSGTQYYDADHQRWRWLPNFTSARLVLLNFLRGVLSRLRCKQRRAVSLEQLYWGLVIRRDTAVAAEVRRFIEWWGTWCRLLVRNRRAMRAHMETMLASLSRTTLAFLAFVLEEGD